MGITAIPSDVSVVAGGDVGGGTSLTTTNAVPKVSSSGVLGEGQLRDNGTVVGLGGLTSSFPALKRSGTTILTRLADDSAAAPFTVGILSGDAGGNIPVWQKFTIGFASLTAAATTQDITVVAGAARLIITGIRVKHSTAFTGGAISAMTISIGDSSSVTFYTAAFDIFQAAADTVFQDTNMLKSSTQAARDVLARFTATGANVNAATAGSVDIWIRREILTA